MFLVYFTFITVSAIVLPSECTNLSIEDRLEKLDSTIKGLQDELINKDHQIRMLLDRVSVLESSIHKQIIISGSEDYIPGVVSNEHKKRELQNDINRDDRNDGSRGVNQTPSLIGINTKLNISSLIIPSKRSRRQDEAPRRAFHAYQSNTRSYGEHEIINYDMEEIDVGGGFNALDSIYDVSVTGVYVFTWTTVSDVHGYIQSELVVNGVVKGITFADAEEVTDIHSSTGIVVVHVNQSDHVYVRRGSNSVGKVISNTVHARSTFSGWLLF